jgi:hypothetical protein
MKYILIFLLIATLGSITAGFLLETAYSQKLIGFGIMGIFFILFPLFTYHRWKDKNLKDYMLTKENLDKMRDKEKYKR